MTALSEFKELGQKSDALWRRKADVLQLLARLKPDKDRALIAEGIPPSEWSSAVAELERIDEIGRAINSRRVELEKAAEAEKALALRQQDIATAKVALRQLAEIEKLMEPVLQRLRAFARRDCMQSGLIGQMTNWVDWSRNEIQKSLPQSPTHGLIPIRLLKRYPDWNLPMTGEHAGKRRRLQEEMRPGEEMMFAGMSVGERFGVRPALAKLLVEFQLAAEAP